ncbi:MAG: hypothetical protein HYX66_06920 [Ignavibacteria bacterium]|nr:hypothetical protein [Ignavibacteria bacterium]
MLIKVRGEPLFTLVFEARSGITFNVHGTEYSCDGNGNLTGFKYCDQQGDEFDNLSTTYQSSQRNNRLLCTGTYTATAAHLNDIEDQGASTLRLQTTLYA